MDGLLGGIIGGLTGGVIGGLIYALAPKRPDGTPPTWVRFVVPACVVLGLSLTRPLIPVVAELVQDYRPKNRAEEFEFRLAREARRYPDLVEWSAKHGSFEAGKELAAKGLLRLPDALIVDGTEAWGRALARMPLDLCGRYVTGAVRREDASDVFAAVSEQDVDLMVQLSVQAQLTEIRGYPAPVIPTEDQIAEAFGALRELDPAADEHLEKGFTDGATPEGRCKATRFFFMRVKAIPERYRGTLARALRM